MKGSSAVVVPPHHLSLSIVAHLSFFRLASPPAATASASHRDPDHHSPRLSDIINSRLRGSRVLILRQREGRSKSRSHNQPHHFAPSAANLTRKSRHAAHAASSGNSTTGECPVTACLLTGPRVARKGKKAPVSPSASRHSLQFPLSFLLTHQEDCSDGVCERFKRLQRKSRLKIS